MKSVNRLGVRFTRALLLALFLTGIFPAVTAFAYTNTASTSPTYFRKIGIAGGTGNGHLNGPTFDTVGPDGSIYVNNLGNHRIEVFSGVNGTYITKWGSSGSGNGQFNSAAGMAADANGNIYVTDFYNNRVQEFDSAGNYISQFGSAGSGNGQFANPAGVAINHTTGTIYVTDSGNHRVQEFSSDGTYLTQWNGGAGHALTTPFSIDINQKSGNVYVSDTGTHKINEYTSGGAYVTQWGSQGSGDGQFEANYMGFAVSQASGQIFVGDSGNSRVEAFTGDGEYLYQWGVHGSANGDFMDNIGIAINQLNQVITVDFNLNRVQEFAVPQELAQETVPGSTDLLNLTLPTGNNITAESVANDTDTNGKYYYPFGLFNFTFIIPDHLVGWTEPIQITYQTNDTPSDVIPQKYDSTTKTYRSIPGATVTQTTVGGKPALMLTYNVTDGAALDQDGAANAIIVDPVTLAVVKPASNGEVPASHATPKAPDTGYGRPTSGAATTIVASLMIFLAICVLIYVRQPRLSHHH